MCPVSRILLGLGKGPLHLGHKYVYTLDRAAARAAFICFTVVLVLYVFWACALEVFVLLAVFFVECTGEVGNNSNAFRFRFALRATQGTASAFGGMSSVRLGIFGWEGVDGRSSRPGGTCCLSCVRFN